MTITDKLNSILNTKKEIKTAIENKGVTVLDTDPFALYPSKINSIKVGEGDTSNIYQVENKNELASLTNIQPDNICLAYSSKTSPVQQGVAFKNITFPSTVVLSSAFDDFVDIRISPVNSGDMLEGWGMLESQMFDWSVYTNNGDASVRYSSMDGITYTLNEIQGSLVSGNTVTLPVEGIFNEYSWNDVLSYFMNISEIIFDGIFIFSDNEWKYLDLGSSVTTADNVYKNETIYNSNGFEKGTFGLVENANDIENRRYINLINDIAAVAKTANTTSPELTFSSLSNVDLSNIAKIIDTSQWTRMDSLFSSNSATTSLKLNHLDTSKVVNMSSVFYGTSNLTELEINEWSLDNVTDISFMFNRLSKLTSLNLNDWNTSQVKDAQYLFTYCTALSDLQISNWDVSSLKNGRAMFDGCKNLTELDLSKWNCRMTNHQSLFSECSSLKVLNIENFDFSDGYTDSGGSFYNMIYKCSSLEDLTFGRNYGASFSRTSANSNYATLDLSYNNQLTHDSLMDVINKLYDLNLTYDVANGGTLRTQSLRLGATNIAKLSEEELAIAAAKGWTVS